MKFRHKKLIMIALILIAVHFALAFAVVSLFTPLVDEITTLSSSGVDQGSTPSAAKK